MDGPPPQEEDFTALSIENRIAHKNWKARVSGYEALTKSFQLSVSDSDPAFKPYVNSPDTLKKIVADSNVAAQEKGVECVVSFVKFAGENAARSREAVVPALVDKCLGSTRAGTKNLAIELVLQYVEVENGGAGVVDNLLPGLAAKQPKVVAGTVTALKEVVRQFGIQVTPPAPILKSLPKIFAHTDKTVRAEGSNLTHSLYQYLGAGIEPFLGDLKPVQVKELKEAWEGMEKDGQGKGSLKPTRYTRKQAREMEESAAAGEEADAPAEEEEQAELDPLQFVEPVDIVPKIPSNMQAGLSSSKWKERKEVLDDLLTLVNATPRIIPAPEFRDISKSLATCIQKDANINCVMVAAQCLEGLAKGLGEPFGQYREAVIPPMLERLKERKATVTDAIGTALDAIFLTTTLEGVIEDLKPAFTHKNPQVKEGVLKFLTRCLSTSKVPIPPAQIKPVSEGLATLLEDSFAGARDEAANALGTLMKMVGERPLGPVMEGLADVRKAKVKEAFEKATVKAKAGGPAPRAAPPPAAAKVPAKKAPPKKAEPAPRAASPPPVVEQEPMAPPKRAPPARFLQKKAPAAAADSPPAAAAPPPAAAPPVKKPPPAAAAAAAAKSSKPPPPAAPGQLDTFKFKHTPEDSEALAAEVIPASIATQFGDANWKTRLAALEEATSWVEAEAEGLDAEVVVRFFAKKGWSEKNFQVSAKLYGILVLLAERCPSFGRSCVALSVPHLTEKLGDMKLKKPAGDAMLVFAEKTSLQFVLNQSYDALGKIKAPKALADALTWIESALREFGIAGLSLRALIDTLKTALGNSNAAVRTSATKTLVTVKLFAGAGIKDLLGDLNPQLLATIQTEFDKVEGQTPPEPTRSSADVAALPAAGAAGKGGAGGGDALDDLFPRVEFDSLLKGTTILADSKSDAWKTKKEALETLQAILDQGPNKRLKPNIGDMVQVLKARVVDANKAVQSLALDIVARIATGMGKPFEKQTKFFIVPVASVLADQKAPTRNAGIATLSAIANACEGMEPLVSGLTTALEVNNPVQRATLLGWLVTWFQDPEHPITKSLDLSGWVPPIVGCLDDRSGDVRKACVGMLPFLIASVGFEKVLAQSNSLKPASKSSAVPLINAARASAPGAAAAPEPPKPAPAAVPKAAPPKPKPAPPPVEELPPPSPPVKASKLGVRNILRGNAPSRPESRSGTDEDAPVPAASRLGKPGLKRPIGLGISSAKAAPPPSAPSPPVTAGGGSLLFTNMNLNTKNARLAKDGTRWVNEGGPTKKELADLLQHQMEPHASPDLVANLFSHDHSAVNDHVAGMGQICDFYAELTAGGDGLGLGPDEARTVGLANSDFALKYASMKAHESQSNVIAKCLDVVDGVLGFMHSVTYELSDAEATCFVPTMVFKLGDARENVRHRVQAIFNTLPKVYAASRIFQTVLEYGLKSKVAKSRQFSLEELEKILKRSGVSAMEAPSKACPAIASMIADKDPSVRKGALAVLSEVYTVEGERIWSLVGPLSPKDKTQLEERLRRVAGPSTPPKSATASALPAAQASRLASGIGRPGSPSGLSARAGIPRPASPAGASRLARPMSPSKTNGPIAASGLARPTSHLPGPTSPTAAASRGRGLLPPSRLGAPKSRLSTIKTGIGRPRAMSKPDPEPEPEPEVHDHGHGYDAPGAGHVEAWRNGDEEPEEPDAPPTPASDITLTISSVLSSDSDRSVDALKRVQKILQLGPEDGPSSASYRDLAEHAEGLVETITLQMNHAFDHPERRIRLAKHLIQTLNAFCDNPLLAESLTVDILTALLEELAMRLLQTDDSPNSEVKNLSRFINMIMLRLFSTGRKITVFRALFGLLLQIVRPFPSHGTQADSQEARVAELVLKCIWKLARSIPQDLEQVKLDPVELFPAIEHFLQSVPPNEWRARSANRVPCGDMPLRTIKVIIQHVVAHYGDDVYDVLSTSFEDPSATIVYPYVYRILNSSNKVENGAASSNGNGLARHNRQRSEGIGLRAASPPATSRADTPVTESAASVVSVEHDARRSSASPSRRTQSVVSANGGYAAEEPDPDAQLNEIFGHISSQSTGAMHKEGITELHHFLKQYPHKRAKVDALLQATGTAFQKYINRALASRAAEDEERNAAVADTLSKLESKSTLQSAPQSPTPQSPPPPPQSPARSRFDSGGDVPRSPMSSTFTNGSDHGHGAGLTNEERQEKMKRLHDMFRYRSSTASSAGGGRATPSLGSTRQPQ